MADLFERTILPHVSSPRIFRARARLLAAGMDRLVTSLTQAEEQIRELTLPALLALQAAQDDPAAAAAAASVVLDGIVSELSVQYNPNVGKWLALYGAPWGIVVRAADAPTGSAGPKARLKRSGERVPGHSIIPISRIEDMLEAEGASRPTPTPFHLNSPPASQALQGRCPRRRCSSLL